MLKCSFFLLQVTCLLFFFREICCENCQKEKTVRRDNSFAITVLCSRRFVWNFICSGMPCVVVQTFKCLMSVVQDAGCCCLHLYTAIPRVLVCALFCVWVGPGTPTTTATVALLLRWAYYGNLRVFASYWDVWLRCYI